ncbi:MAG: hypothetical protein JWP84_2112 [Tardiphaga sp.]|nr:hypothetical protein [Tardiphaga sp.]
MRTVWLALIFLLGLGTLIISKASTTQYPAVTGALPERLVVPSHVVDTLTKADKLSVAYVREAVEDRPAPFAGDPESIPASTPHPAGKIKSRHWHESSGKSHRDDVSSRQALTKPSNKKQKTDAPRAKAVAEAKACPQPNGFDGLLRVLNLKPRCDT